MSMYMNYNRPKKYKLEKLPYNPEPTTGVFQYPCLEMGCTNNRTLGSDFCLGHSPDPNAELGELLRKNFSEVKDTSFEDTLVIVLAEIGDLLRKKNADYGSSYDKSVEKYGKTVPLIRLLDKFNRLESLILSDSPGLVEEKQEETLSDLVGYGIIELVRRRRSNNG